MPLYLKAFRFLGVTLGLLLIAAAVARYYNLAASGRTYATGFQCSVCFFAGLVLAVPLRRGGWRRLTPIVLALGFLEAAWMVWRISAMAWHLFFHAHSAPYLFAGFVITIVLCGNVEFTRRVFQDARGHQKCLTSR